MKKIYVDFAIENPKEAAERFLQFGQGGKGKVVTKNSRGDYIINDVKSIDQECYHVFGFDDRLSLV